MTIRYTNTFKKQYKKLPSKIQTQFDNRLKLFIKDQTDSRLRVHPLKGRYAGYWSMSVSGDFRALFRRDGDEIIIFGLIGTHSELYG
jgi:addiction module RelE/StbE family toxin